MGGPGQIRTGHLEPAEQCHKIQPERRANRPYGVSGPQERQVVISVADHGMGISPADSEALFTTFHRVHRPETIGIKGAGLGLYIVKVFTEAMGGRVWLESELDKGTTFYIALPVNTEDADNNTGETGVKGNRKNTNSTFNAFTAKEVQANITITKDE